MAPEFGGGGGPAPATNRTAADAIVGALARHGVDVMVGQSIPTQLYLSAPDHGIRQFSIRTEKAAAMVADGYARVTNKVGVCTSVAGPGAALLVAGMGEAYKASIPVLALVGDTPTRHLDRNHAQEMDHIELFRSVTKFARRVERADRVEEYIDLAMATATSGRPGPVALMLPADLFGAPAPEDAGRVSSLGHYPLDRSVADPERVDEAARLLAQAECPVVMAGGGVHVSQACPQLARLQDLASLPVATTMMGKGTVSEEHPLSLGVVGYAMARRSSGYHHRALIARADVVLLIGNRTNQNGTDNWSLIPKGARVIHLDVDGQEIGRNYEALRLLGDARLTLDALIQRIGRLDLSKRRAAREGLEREIAAAREAWRKAGEALMSSGARPVRPERVVAEMGRRLTPQTVVVADASYATVWMADGIRLPRAGQRFISPRGLAGIGWGYPMALGVQLGRPGAPVWFLGGDGGFAHAWGELETATREGLPVKAVILNNQVLGYQKDAEDVAFRRHTPACHFTPVDHAAIARACGMTGIRVEDPADLADAMAEAEKADGPALIDVVSDPEAVAPITGFDGKLPDTQ